MSTDTPDLNHDDLDFGEFELCYGKRAAEKGPSGLEKNDELWITLGDIPSMFTPTTGSYAFVAKEASRLNEAQLKSGFLYWNFFPEIKQAGVPA